MKWLKLLISILFLALFFVACKNTKNENPNSPLSPTTNIDFKENNYVIHKEHIVGDSRRYGIFPNKKINKTYLYNILTLAENGIPIKFSKGFYNTNLILKGRKNIKLFFDDAEFSGQIQIIDDKNKIQSNSITFKGKLTTYNKFFSRNSSKIKIDTLIIASDTLKNKFKKRSLGCNIYAGTTNLEIKKLIVKDLGSGDSYYTYSMAALQIHGWNNNPENVVINEAIIEKSDRHGVYITGKNHVINNLIIKDVGLGTTVFNNGLEDAHKNEIHTISSLWINRCDNSFFKNVKIFCNNSNAQYSVNFDEGIPSEPTIIDSLSIYNCTNQKMFPNKLTNIIVRKFKENE